MYVTEYIHYCRVTALSRPMICHAQRVSTYTVSKYSKDIINEYQWKLLQLLLAIS